MDAASTAPTISKSPMSMPWTLFSTFPPKTSSATPAKERTMPKILMSRILSSKNRAEKISTTIGIVAMISDVLVAVVYCRPRVSKTK